MIRFFRHYFSAVYLGLLFIEFLLFFYSLYLAVHVRFLFSHNQFSENYLLIASFCYATILSFCCSIFGMYRRNLRWNDFELIPRISFSFSAAILGIISLFYVFPDLLVGRGILFFSFIFSYAGMFFLRLWFFKYLKQDSLKRRILVIGCGKNAAKIIQSNIDHVYKGFEIIGCIPLKDEKIAIDEKLVINHQQSLMEIVKQNAIQEIVIAIKDRRHKNLPISELLECKMSGVDVLDQLTFYEREKAYIDLDNLNPSWLVFSDGFVQTDSRLVSKRMFDVGASLFLLFITWPVMLLTIVAIYLESGLKQPVLYRQMRVGEHNNFFEVIKFRSMKTDAEVNGAQFASENDDRVTKVGRFIRKVRIDELPQLFNVLKGEMSFVGPRPERPEFVDQFEKNIPYYQERHRLKPGITGWAQLCYPYGAGEYDAIQKLQYDLYYIKNHSLLLDLIIMLHTVEVILWSKGSR